MRADPDPAASMAPAIRAAIDAAAAAGRELSVVVSLCGTADDPQDREAQAAALVAAGAWVFASNASAARAAASLTGTVPAAAEPPTGAGRPAPGPAGRCRPDRTCRRQRRPGHRGVDCSRPGDLCGHRPARRRAAGSGGRGGHRRLPPDGVRHRGRRRSSGCTAFRARRPARGPANALAAERMLAVRAQLVDVRPAREALGLRPGEFCHAGPPIDVRPGLRTTARRTDRRADLRGTGRRRGRGRSRSWNPGKASRCSRAMTGTRSARWPG